MSRMTLYRLAHGRSGDKGDTVNVGVIALRPEFWDAIREQVTVERFELPNLHALNFLLHESLGGGGTVSLRTDAQGKTLSTAMLRMEIDVPDELAGYAAPSA